MQKAHWSGFCPGSGSGSGSGEPGLGGSPRGPSRHLFGLMSSPDAWALLPWEETAINHLPTVPTKMLRKLRMGVVSAQRRQAGLPTHPPARDQQRCEQDVKRCIRGTAKAPPSINQPRPGRPPGCFPLSSHEGEGVLLAEDPIGLSGLGLTWPDPLGGPHVCSAPHTPRTPGVTQHRPAAAGTPCAGRAQALGPRPQTAHRRDPGTAGGRGTPPGRPRQVAPPLSAPAASSVERGINGAQGLSLIHI